LNYYPPPLSSFPTRRSSDLSNYSTTSSITGTNDPTLYKSSRYGSFNYSIPVSNGSYNLTLHFAELYFTSAGQRVFHVDINGSRADRKSTRLNSSHQIISYAV